MTTTLAHEPVPGFTNFLAEIARVPLLTAVEERELARRVSEGRPGLAVRVWARLTLGRATRPEPRAV